MLLREPPVDAISNVNVEPDYNSAKVTYDALEGATMYRVSYKADAKWTKVCRIFIITCKCNLVFVNYLDYWIPT